MKIKTKNRIRRTVAVSLIGLTLAAAVTTSRANLYRKALKNDFDDVEAEVVELVDGIQNCLDSFKQTSYYTQQLIAEKENLSNKFQNAEISSEEYALKTSNLLSDEHTEELLLNSNEEVLKGNYLDLLNTYSTKKQEYDEIADSRSYYFNTVLASVVLGTSCAGLAIWAYPNKRDEELEMQEMRNR